jgi:putative membrane protein
MQRGTQLFVAALFAVTAAACGNNGARGSGTPGAAGTAGAGSALDMGERHFVQDQLKDGAREVELGQLAEKRATSPDVKEFASEMVQDHTRAGNKLKELAKKEDVDVDVDDNKDSRDDYDRLSKKSGADFDKDYIDLMVKDHKDAVDALQDQANNADHADVKTWAAETLPRVKHHLEMAQQLQDRLNNPANSPKTDVVPKKSTPKKSGKIY